MKTTVRSTLLTLSLAATLAVLVVPAVHAAEFRMEKTLSLASGGVLDLKTDAGRVSVRGTSRSDVQVIVSSDDEGLADKYDFSFEERGDRVVIRVEKRGNFTSRWFSWKDSPEFDIEVPRRSSLEIRTSGGRISARDIDGTADLHTSGGRIELETISGTVDASTSGGSISATELGATADLSSSGGSIGVEGIAGDLKVKTSGGSIDISDAGGRVNANTSGGSVTASFTPGNSAGGSLSSSGGRITAYIDATAALDLDASSSGGGVTVDLPVTVQGRMSRRAVRGSLNGGGPLLRLHTSGGGVRVKAL